MTVFRLRRQKKKRLFTWIRHRGNDNNTGESDTAAVQTLSKALGLVAQNGVIYLLNPVDGR